MSMTDRTWTCLSLSHRLKKKELTCKGLWTHDSAFEGHSLGGAVAQLCTLRLLNQLPKGSKPALRCMTFACPAVGNPSLSSYVQASGWVPFFQNLLIPGVQMLLNSISCMPRSMFGRLWSAQGKPQGCLQICNSTKVDASIWTSASRLQLQRILEEEYGGTNHSPCLMR